MSQGKKKNWKKLLSRGDVYLALKRCCFTKAWRERGGHTLVSAHEFPMGSRYTFGYKKGTTISCWHPSFKTIDTRPEGFTAREC